MATQTQSAAAPRRPVPPGPARVRVLVDTLEDIIRMISPEVQIRELLSVALSLYVRAVRMIAQCGRPEALVTARRAATDAAAALQALAAAPSVEAMVTVAQTRAPRRRAPDACRRRPVATDGREGAVEDLRGADRLAREADDEIADLHLVAQGVKHYGRCTSEEPCVRCRFDVFRAENDADELRALLVDLRAVEAAGWCDVCAGMGQPALGEACMCGGTGLASAQVAYLRERLAEVEAAREAALAQMRREQAQLAKDLNAAYGSAAIDAQEFPRIVAQMREENDRVARENLNMAAELVFVRGGDIPETIERARAVLVVRLHEAEAALAQTREDLEAIRATRDRNELRAKAACRLVDVWRARAEQAEAALAQLQESLRDPTVAHIALLRGDIARPSEGNLRHLYPEWGQAEAERDQMRAALEWLVHLHHGVSKAGGPPQPGEWEYAWDDATRALDASKGPDHE